MNKNELIRAIANNARIKLKDASDALDCVIDTITEALNNGEKIQISGFGTFELKVKPARDGINPKTQEKITDKNGNCLHFMWSKREWHSAYHSVSCLAGAKQRCATFCG